MIADEFYKKINLNETDFFARMREAIIIKMDLLATYPDIFKFIQEVFMDDSAEIKVEFDQKKTELTHINIEKVYEGIDFSKFRDDVDVQKVFKIITWTFEKMSDEELYKAKFLPNHEINYQEIMAEAEEYFEIFIKCFYK
jgi:TetR/AcrR family transcriptional regulator